ncbi:hypothetical protein MKZ38_009310 [Zalerion maritima]|uniref:Uncharacterized protein n=1 Tax=Zalerion maritima TaxID=339359 RepID=A0AAD5RUA8_9PEZI|nr:hypothetical protein MKZ38_009310 [Zalerion maritima]
MAQKRKLSISGGEASADNAKMAKRRLQAQSQSGEGDYPLNAASRPTISMLRPAGAQFRPAHAQSQLRPTASSQLKKRKATSRDLLHTMHQEQPSCPCSKDPDHEPFDCPVQCAYCMSRGWMLYRGVPAVNDLNRSGEEYEEGRGEDEVLEYDLQPVPIHSPSECPLVCGWCLDPKSPTHTFEDCPKVNSITRRLRSAAKKPRCMICAMHGKHPLAQQVDRPIGYEEWDVARVIAETQTGIDFDHHWAQNCPWKLCVKPSCDANFLYWNPMDHRSMLNRQNCERHCSLCGIPRPFITKDKLVSDKTWNAMHPKKGSQCLLRMRWRYEEPEEKGMKMRVDMFCPDEGHAIFEDDREAWPVVRYVMEQAGHGMQKMADEAAKDEKKLLRMWKDEVSKRKQAGDHNAAAMSAVERTKKERVFKLPCFQCKNERMKTLDGETWSEEPEEDGFTH